MRVIAGFVVINVNIERFRDVIYEREASTKALGITSMKLK